MDAGFFDEEIKAKGGRVYYSSPLTLLNIWRKRREFTDFLQRHREYKIIHVQMNEWSTVFCHAAKDAGVPVRIAHSRGANKQLSVSRLIKDFIKLPIKKYATDYFAVSIPAAVKLFGKNAYKNGIVKIWPNAIDCKKFSYSDEKRKEIREKLMLDDAFTMVHVGNFTPAKNHSFLLRIFARLKQMEPNAKLMLIGGGDSSTCKEEAIEIGVKDSTIFLGVRSDVNDLLQACDCFVFPSLHEGFPGAVLEAQASGLPCVISDVITEEVCLLPSTVRLPLSHDAEYWMRRILDAKQDYPRESAAIYVANQGYDVIQLSGKLTEFYLDSYQTQGSKFAV